MRIVILLYMGSVIICRKSLLLIIGCESSGGHLRATISVPFESAPRQNAL